MKKLFTLLALIVGLQISLLAQSQQSSTTSRAQTAEVAQKMDYVKDCPALQAQLKGLFGEAYSLEQPKVIAQLQHNIADAQADRCIRKSSLKVIYGADYVNKLHLIDINTSKTTTK